MTEPVLYTLFAAVVLSLAVVGLIVAYYAVLPIEPHPDLNKIQRPLQPDPSIVVERREHD